MMEEIRLVSPSGKVHRAFRVGDALYTAEADNIDDVKDAIILTIEEAADLANDKCQRCFKEDETDA